MSQGLGFALMSLNQKLRAQPQPTWLKNRHITWPRSRGALPCASILLLVVLCLGCQSGMFTPSNLPDNLVAKPVISATQLNLAGLDSGTINLNSIYPGDVLQVTVVTGADERRDSSWRLRVDERGSITLPQVGPIRVAGFDLVAAERQISDVYRQRQIYLHPSVSLTVESRRTKRVTVEGAVAKPGDYDLPASDADLTAALLAAGGLTDEADTIVEVRQVRGATSPNRMSATEAAPYDAQQAGFQRSSSHVQVHRIDLAMTQGEKQSPHFLDDGAVVTVIKRPTPAIGVVGLVKNSKQIDFPVGKEMRVLDAIAKAGGTNTELANKVFVVRRIPDGNETAIIKTSIRQAKRDLAWNVLLAPGDVVSVEETPQTFAWRGLRDMLNTAFLGLRLYTFPF